MSKTTSHMSLRVWSSLGDDFDHEQLADNWAKVDSHDHSTGRGVQIGTEGIFEEAITEEKLAKPLRNRLFLETVAYGSNEILAEAKPKSVVANSLIVATIKVKANINTKLQIVVEGKDVQEYDGEGLAKIALTFPVPANKLWEWTKTAGTVESFSFRTVEL